MTNLFTRMAEAVGAECSLAGDRRQAIEAVLSAALKEGVGDAPGRWAVWADDGFLEDGEREDISRRAPGVRFDVSREIAAQALIGISTMDWGVAETGTLLSDSSAAGRRLASTLPPIHVALLPANRILADMGAALARLDTARCAYMAAITGPSRTADIERVLTIGVHGPRRLLIILIQDPRQGGAPE